MEVPLKTRELLYNLAITLLCIYPEKTTILKDTCIPMFTAPLFYNGQDKKLFYPIVTSDLFHLFFCFPTLSSHMFILLC